MAAAAANPANLARLLENVRIITYAAVSLLPKLLFRFLCYLVLLPGRKIINFIFSPRFQMGSGDFDLRFMALKDFGAVLKSPARLDEQMLAKVRL